MICGHPLYAYIPSQLELAISIKVDEYDNVVKSLDVSPILLFICHVCHAFDPFNNNVLRLFRVHSFEDLLYTSLTIWNHYTTDMEDTANAEAIEANVTYVKSKKEVE